MIKGSCGLTIKVHSTMHLTHHNYCQTATMTAVQIPVKILDTYTYCFIYIVHTIDRDIFASKIFHL